MKMKVSKAIERIEGYVEVWDLEQADEEIKMIIFKDDIRAFKTAIKVLEKNTPKNPILLTYLPLIENGWKYGCPSCKLAVGGNSYCFDYTDEDEYCPSCGQKLNWD